MLVYKKYEKHELQAFPNAKCNLFLMIGNR